MNREAAVLLIVGCTALLVSIVGKRIMGRRFVSRARLEEQLNEHTQCMCARCQELREALSGAENG